MLVEIYLLEQLAAFARNGTLSAASEELHLTQPTLTRSMQKLEQVLGVPLFDRIHKTIHLNENGLLAADYAARILSLEGEMMKRLYLQERSRTSITLGSISPGPVKELVPRLSDLVRGETISAEEADEQALLDGLRNNYYQIIALNHSVNDDSLYCQKVFGERLYFCYYPDDSKTKPEGVWFQDIDGTNILVPDKNGFWDELVHTHMHNSTFIIQDTNRTLNLVAENSTLPAFSSDIGIKHDIVRPNRIAVPILDDSAYADYYCICSKSNAKMIKIISLLAPPNNDSI